MMYKGLTFDRLLGPVLALSLLLVSSIPVLAGAWLRDEGQTQIIFSGAYTGARHRFDEKGKPKPSGSFTKQSFHILAEHGYSDRLTLIAGTSGLHQSFPAGGLHKQGVEGSFQAGGRIKLWSQGGTVLSAQLTAEASGERRFGFPDRRFAPPVMADSRLLLGQGFAIAGINGFFDLQMGWRWRGGAHPDEIHVDATLGLRPFARTLLLFQSFNSASAGKDRRLGLGPARQHKFQTSLVYDMTDRLAIQAGLFGSVSGRDVLKERGALLALWWKL